MFTLFQNAAGLLSVTLAYDITSADSKSQNCQCCGCVPVQLIYYGVQCRYYATCVSSLENQVLGT